MNSTTSHGNCLPPSNPSHTDSSTSTEPPKLPEKNGFCRNYRSFPLQTLPVRIRRFVVAYARLMDCDPAYLAVPVLAVLASCIGNTRRIRVLGPWEEPAIIWAVIVGNSGSRKSPALDAAVRPLRDRQDKAFKSYRTKLADHERAKADLEYDVRTRRGQCSRPSQPPTVKRHIVNDVTVEAVAKLLNEQPRGLLVARDEISGWLVFDRYSTNKGADVSNWLEMHGGRSITVDRATKPTIHIPHASVSVVGGIQPAILAGSLNSTHVACGLVARILFAFPPPRPRKWVDGEIDSAISDRYAKAVGKLLELEFDVDDDSEPTPKVVVFAPNAEERFKLFVNEFGAQMAELNDAMAASHSKLEGYAARFALVIHLTRWATGERIDPDVCDLESVEAGIALTHWFTHEARRIHSILTESSSETAKRKLVEWVQRRGGKATVRDVCRSGLQRKAEDAEVALKQLVGEGIGTWEMVSTGDTGGRPTRQFCLIELDETPVDLDDLDGCVNVDESQDGPGTCQFDDDDEQLVDFEDAVDYNKLDDFEDWTRSHAG